MKVEVGRAVSGRRALPKVRKISDGCLFELPAPFIGGGQDAAMVASLETLYFGTLQMCISTEHRNFLGTWIVLRSKRCTSTCAVGPTSTLTGKLCSKGAPDERKKKRVAHECCWPCAPQPTFHFCRPARWPTHAGEQEQQPLTISRGPCDDALMGCSSLTFVVALRR